jgi:hypothetical protein
MECGFQKVFNFGGTLWGTHKNVALVDTIGIYLFFRGVFLPSSMVHLVVARSGASPGCSDARPG